MNEQTAGDERARRNEVFAAQKKAELGIDSAMPAMAASEAMRVEFGIDIPVETVPLPSCGRVYPSNNSLAGRDTVDIRPMTAREEDILTSQALLKKGTVITELIRSCLVDRGIDPTDMLVGDRNALMVAIRITGYGNSYDAEVTCAECDAKTPRAFDLAELPIQRLEIEPVEEGLNLFEFLLPYTKKRVRFKFLTGRDEEEILAMQQKQQKLGLQSDSLVTTNLLHSIVSIDNTSDRSKVAQFIRMMPARDSLALRQYVRDAEPGIRMKQESTCSKCGHVAEVSMPLGVTFLWPAAA